MVRNDYFTDCEIISCRLSLNAPKLAQLQLQSIKLVGQDKSINQSELPVNSENISIRVETETNIDSLAKEEKLSEHVHDEKADKIEKTSEDNDVSLFFKCETLEDRISKYYK